MLLNAHMTLYFTMFEMGFVLGEDLNMHRRAGTWIRWFSFLFTSVKSIVDPWRREDMWMIGMCSVV